jgi:DNA-directed RNA polymerase subunit RPC12/RpoP
MKPDLEMTSVPPWAVTPQHSDADLSGRSWTIVGFGVDAEPVVAAWTAQIAAHQPMAHISVHAVADDDAAVRALDSDLAGALVGWRLMIVGPADACLRLRARALRLGIADDEIVVATTAVSTRDVLCAHCGARTRAEIGLEGIVACLACGRRLLVYYHVSRMQAAHLGFMADAEEVTAS